MEFRRRETAAVRLDRADGLIDVLDHDRAFESDHLLALRELAALLQAAVIGSLWSGAGLDQIEIRRSPRLERPSENRLIEPTRARHIVGVNRKEGKVVRHTATLRRRARRCLALD